MAVATLAYDMRAAGQEFILTVNGKDLTTPAGKPYALPTQALAKAILPEWQAQKGKPNPATMPLTQLAATCLDRVNADRTTVITQLVTQLDDDMLCLRADQPDNLRLRQQETWQPYLDWFLARYDALLKISIGLLPEPQTPAAHAALNHALRHYSSWQLTGLAYAASLTHSVVLGLALAEQVKSADEIFAAAELEALLQMDKWGSDPLAVARHKAIRQDLRVCEQWFRLCRFRSD